MTSDYTPALGNAALTPFYDMIVALLTREQKWRRALVDQLSPLATDSILDVGCGTGSLLKLIADRTPEAALFGLDPDASIIARAQKRTAKHPVRFSVGFARDAGGTLSKPMDKVVSTLVLHQVPMAEKRAGLSAMLNALRSGGELHIADYGLQRTRLMRALFRQVQRVDGFENTTPNAKGILPELMNEVGFKDVAETQVVPTLTGSISLYRARKP